MVFGRQVAARFFCLKSAAVAIRESGGAKSRKVYEGASSFPVNPLLSRQGSIIAGEKGLEEAVKPLGLLILALCVAAGGCAKSASKKVQDPQASRLDNLEAGFARFQEQQRARDADIDLKLREIVTSLDRLNAGKPPAPKSRKARERVKEPAKTRQPIVAGQIIPYSQLVGQQGPPVQQASAGAYPGQPTPGYAGQPAPGQPSPASGRQPQPVAQQGSQGQIASAYTGQPAPASAGRQPAYPGQPAQPVQAGVQPSQSYSQPSATGLKPPVVTLGDPYQGVQPTPPQRPAVPVEPRRGKGRSSSRAPQPVEQASAAPAAAYPAATAPSALAPAVPGAAPAPAAASSPAPAAAPGASGDMREMQLYTDALRSISANKSEDGRKKFNDFLAKHPNSPKAPEAFYWIGESYMGDKSYNQAILSFKEVTGRFPKDPKAQEALFRTAEAYERLGDKANAAFQLKLLVDEHPNSEFAGKARQKLKQLGQ
jgi:tol-pal system protein YbgF